MEAITSFSKSVSGFDPRSISGCVLWLDGADPNATGVLPSNGSTISTWTDKSVYGNNATLSVLQGTPSAPTFSTSISPGSVAFNGTSQLLGVSNLTADSSANTGESGFAVVNLTNYTNVNTIFGAIAKSGQTYNTAGRQFRLDASTIRTNRQASTTLLTTSSSPSFSNSTTYLVEFVNTNFNNNSSGTATLTHYQSGTLLGTFTYTTSSTANNYQTGLTTSIGGRASSATAYTEYSAGNFMELLLYNSGVTQADRQLIEGYLAWKWGLQSSLPATHPYRSSLGIKPFSRLFWSPDVTGLVFWIDASGGTSTGLTINGSNNVTAVTDLSGYGSNSTSVSGTAAYLTNVHPSGLGAISLCKTGAINFPGTYAMNTIGAGYDYALICTCSFSAFTTVNYPAQNIYAKTANNPTLYFYFSGGLQLFRHLSSVNGSSININVSNPLSANQWSIITLLCRRGINNQIYLTFNGAWNWASPAATGATFETAANTGAFVLGANYDAANPTVYFGEVMCIVGPSGTSATRTQIQSAEAYLAKKWGTRSTFSSTHPFYNYIHSSPTFNPLQFSSLALWLDASDSTTVTTSGSTVTAWNDKSGNGRNTTIAGNPTLSSASLNRLNGIQFSGSSQSWTSPSFALSSTSQVSAFVVANGTKTISQNANLLISSTTSNFDMFLNFSSTTQYAYYMAGSASTNTSFTNTSGIPNLYEIIFDASTATAYANGSLVSTLSSIVPGTTLTSSQTLGCSMAGSTSCIEYEILFFSTNLSPSQRQKIEGYLAWKWGINSKLSSTHPYYKVMP